MTPVGVGAFVIVGIGAIALSETPVAPLIAAALVLAIVYNGLAFYGDTHKGGGGGFGGHGASGSYK